MKFLLVLSIFTIQPCFAGFRHFPHDKSRTTKEPMISKTKFKRIIRTMEKEFLDFPQYMSEQMTIYGDWNDPTADMALARRWENAQVLIFRGMAHRREIDQDALALIICHEIGHLYGGHPLKNQRDYIAAEGQADYFASNMCIRRALRLFSPNNLEQRAKKAILAVGRFLANNWGHEHPSEDTPDQSIIEQTNLEHPSPQCRFDTYMSGLNNQNRPRCWYSHATEE